MFSVQHQPQQDTNIWYIGRGQTWNPAKTNTEWKGNTSLPRTALSTAVNWKWDFTIAREKNKNKRGKRNKVTKGLLKWALFSLLTARKIELHQILKLNIQHEIKEENMRENTTKLPRIHLGIPEDKDRRAYFTTQQEQREVLKSGAFYVKP